MRAVWLVMVIVLLVMGCSLKQNVIFENGCDCTTEVYIREKGFVSVKAYETNLDFALWDFMTYQPLTATTDVLEYKIRQKGVVYQYDLDSRQYEMYAFARKYRKETRLPRDEYRYRVDGSGRLFILDKDGDWNALTAIGYVLKTYK